MVSTQTNSQSAHLDNLEANLRSMAARMPGLPFTEVLLCRLVMYAGREMAAGLEQKIRVLTDWTVELFFPPDIVQTIDLSSGQ